MSPARLRYYLASLPTLLAGVVNWPAVLAALLRRPPRAPFVVRLRGGCRLKVAGALDVWLVKEVCLDREYERHGVAVPPGGTVVDIGAGLGEFCVSVARDHPECRVYAFEPSAEAYALLQDNLRLNGLGNVTTFPLAVGARAGRARLHAVGGTPARGRTAGVAGPGADAAVTVPATTLDAIFLDLDIERCDVLKLDCEGAEYDILFGAGSRTLARVTHIALEYHNGVTPFSGDDAAAFLRRHGFAVRTVPNRAWPDRIGLLYATRPHPA